MKYLVFALLAAFLALLFFLFGENIWKPIYLDYTQNQKLESLLAEARGNETRSLQELLLLAGSEYPPQSISLLVIKDESRMELWANHGSNRHSLIKNYPVLAASGVLGPKLREGDKQVPEGIYKVLWLNPNSSYHLSMKLNYPNEFDMRYAIEEGREDAPGSDIFIHGKAVSIGCVAIGDPAIEELYALAEQMDLNDIEVIIAPRDPRVHALNYEGHSYWVEYLYQDIRREFLKYQR